jgi:outer membrane protein assembly factor BamB
LVIVMRLVQVTEIDRMPRSIGWQRIFPAAPLLAGFLAGLAAGPAAAADWPRFRGDNGAGVAAESAPTPVQWSEHENLRWSAALPGPGNSSPIVVGQRVIVTCWTGDNPPGDLVRHLLCFDLATGRQLWANEIKPADADEPYRGMFTENGYASHTPVSDGEQIYAFFGIDGVRAFDMEGAELWRTTVGNGADPNGWGTASSPILYNDLVIVTAASESASIVALDKRTGAERWRQEADALAGTWGTPVLVDAGEGRRDLVLAVPGELWGLNPDTGKLRWYAEGPRARSICSSAIASEGTAYVIGGREGGSYAVRAGGKGDVTESHTLWTNSQRGGISTAVMADGLIYAFTGGVAACFDAATGKQVYEKRLAAPPARQPSATAAAPAAASPASAPAKPNETASTDSAPPTAPQSPQPAADAGFGRPGEFAEPGAFGGFGGFGGRGGGMRRQDYSSPVIADGKLYFVRRTGETYVLALGREFKQLAVNVFASDDGDFNATPAVSDGALVIRSSNKLYCVAAEAR